MLVSFIVEPILAHKEGNVFFKIIVFGSLSQQSVVCGFFFFPFVLKWIMA